MSKKISHWKLKEIERTKIKRYCERCGKELKRTIYPSGRKEALCKFLNRKFCSLYCARHSDFIKNVLNNNVGVGNKNPNWRGGKNIRKDGYIEIWQPHHPMASKHGYVLEHRLIMEKKLGRFLTKAEVVHHINEIKNDNRIENLRLFKNCGFHLNYHLNKKNNENLLLAKR